MEKRTVNITRIETPLGAMIAAATDRGVCMLEYADSKHLEPELRQLSAAFGSGPAGSKGVSVVGVVSEDKGVSDGGGDNPHLDALKRQLEEYFKGERREFEVPLELVGTPFQKEAWEALRRIPYGGTVTYREQAARIGRPSATRAVANANGRNKISIVLPCHRVIGADGSLTGYGGGIERKKKLLELESRIGRTI